MVDDNISAILNSIIEGYSEYSISCEDGNNFIAYIKHPRQKELGFLYKIYTDSFNKYKKDGVPSKEEQFQFICDQGWWSQEKEKEIKYIQDSLARLQNTKKKLIYESDKKRIIEQINDLHNKLFLLEQKKSEYISLTAEDMAANDSANFFIENFIFLEIDFINKIDLDIQSEDCLKQITLAYYKYLEENSSINIKKAALHIPFQNMLYISCGSCIDVFGVPVIKLTKNQIELLMWGNYYQKLIKSSQKDIPEELYDDPDKFLEWYESVNKINVNQKSSKKQGKKNKYGSESKFLFGERDEIKKMGENISGDKVLNDVAQSQSQSLGMYDLMEK